MGVNVKRCLSLATVIVVFLVLLNLNHCKATSLRSNGNASQCNNRMDGDMESELMLDSETNRMLQAINYVTAKTSQLGPVLDCGRRNPYKPCLDNKGATKPPPNCGIYNRNCPG